MRARGLLGPSGPLALTWPGYEHREGQLQMADAVERAIDEDRVLLCEAGTGTGKTLAYLVPAVLSERVVVVSTASKALQEQIFFKDIPLIERELGLEARAVLVKGLSNYLCLRRFEALRADPARASTAVRRALPLVESWAARTRVGDLAELDEVDEGHPVRAAVASSSDTRIGSRCPHHDRCHVTRLKREAANARLLVVNHHLFFADLALKGDHPGGALPPYDAVILDEAHRVENAAGDFFGRRVSSAGVQRLIRDGDGALVRAEHDDPGRFVTPALERADRFFALVNLAIDGSRSPLPDDRLPPQSIEAYHALDDALAALEGPLDDADAAGHEAAGQCAKRTTRLRDDLAALAEPSAPEVRWAERATQHVSLRSSPIDVGPILREKLFARGLPVVLTSASLTTSGSFDFARDRLGLNGDVEAPVDSLVVDEALDHRGQALVYVATDLPEVRDAAFAAAAGARIAELIETTPGGAFVLCTSNRSMRELAGALRASGRRPWVQGDAPKHTLLERFMAAGDGVLVATMSFWEGVDVPGAALRLVVIDRLPFAVPTDPLVAARCRALEKRGHDPFRDYSVPQASLVLKQGYGRLLRTRSDTGVVALLDRRIRTKRYGAKMLASLPPAPVTESLEDVRAFWQRLADAPW